MEGVRALLTPSQRCPVSRANVLYVVAEADFLSAADIRRQPGDVFYTTAKYRTLPTLQEFIQSLRNNARKSGPISLLSFQCHGYRGGLVLWRGGQPAGRLDLNGSNVGQMRAFRDCMAPGGRVELHSCNTGSAFGATMSARGGRPDGSTSALTNASSWGQRFMQGLADALECPVSAAVRTQPGRAAIEFVGPVVTFEPALCSE
jgi:hypothetical protein